MGRPKKRQRTEEEEHQASAGSQNTSTSGQQHRQQLLWGNGLLAGTNGAVNFSTSGQAHNGLVNFNVGDVWMQNADWGSSTNNSILSEQAIPGLTPDSSSNTPPTINLPPELQSSAAAAHTHQHAHRDPSTQMLLDPSLVNGTNLGVPQSGLPSCACLSTMYLSLNILQSMDSSFTFPFALHPLREAMQTAFEVLECQQCPTKFITAVQNTQLLGTLLMSIAERYSKVLESITSESLRAEVAVEMKKFRLQDLNTSTSHLHGGGLGCAAVFAVEMSPADWRGMAKKVVRAEVHGPSDGNNCCCYFKGLTAKMQERQEKWHRPDHVMPDDMPRTADGTPIGGHYTPKEDHVCMKLIAYADKLVEGFDWS
jgi:hypothetical protein